MAPLSAVLVVVLGVVSGGERAVRSARVYGGPTQGQTELGLRVELGERDRIAEVALPDTALRLVAIQGGQRVATATARSDELGMAEVVLRLPRAIDSAFELWVEPAASVDEPAFAKGLVLGSLSAFRASADRRGGFQTGRHAGSIELAVAPLRGVLVTAQASLDDELLIRAQTAGAAVEGARLEVELEGAEPARAELTTDAQGLARLRLRPSDAKVRVAVKAFAAGVGDGTLAVQLNVVQGAIRASRAGQQLRLESGGAASLVFATFFDENRRYRGVRVQLAPAPDGRLIGEIAWPSGLPESPLWVVTSSQADLASPAAVGWSMAPELPAQTFDARELLLLDGAPSARAREARRARRVRLVTAGYAALALGLTLWLFVRRVREAEQRIERHLARSGLDDATLGVAPAGKARTLLAAACIGLGFLVLALLALLKD
ncbi:MAG TPA: hypothetical protein VIW29_16895 [Polyangiaceae bacterium]